MKAVIISDDEESVEDISQACNTCYPEFEFVSTNLGGKGIELAKEEFPDIILLDLTLPNRHGYDVLKQVRNCSKVPVVILSFLRDEATIVRSFELGANEYIVKPFSKLEFIARVRALLRKK